MNKPEFWVQSYTDYSGKAPIDRKSWYVVNQTGEAFLYIGTDQNHLVLEMCDVSHDAPKAMENLRMGKDGEDEIFQSLSVADTQWNTFKAKFPRPDTDVLICLDYEKFHQIPRSKEPGKYLWAVLQRSGYRGSRICVKNMVTGKAWHLSTCSMDRLSPLEADRLRIPESQRKFSEYKVGLIPMDWHQMTDLEVQMSATCRKVRDYAWMLVDPLSRKQDNYHSHRDRILIPRCTKEQYRQQQQKTEQKRLGRMKGLRFYWGGNYGSIPHVRDIRGNEWAIMGVGETYVFLVKSQLTLMKPMESLYVMRNRMTRKVIDSVSPTGELPNMNTIALI